MIFKAILGLLQLQNNYFLSFYTVQNKVPTILDAWGWCTGRTQRDGMGREEGGGFRRGNTCIPVVDS